MHTQIIFSRRHFLKIAAIAGAAGTSMLIGCSLAPEQAAPAASQPALPSSPPVLPATAVLLAAGPFSPNAWLRIDPDETITIWVARSEMGQGVQTALPMLVAEELEADWPAIRVAQAPADAARYGDQNTGGSASVASSFTALRQAGAAAREMLIAAAAHTWGVDTASCRAERGAVLHPPSGRRLTYGALAGSAAALTPPRMRDLRLKQPGEFRIIGTRVARLDAPAKVDGSAVFGLDVRVPGMRYAVIARCPVFGGQVAAFDPARARAIPGVQQVLQVPSGVAVVADTTWAAMRGRAALDITWDEGSHAGLNGAELQQRLVERVREQAAQSPAAGTGEVKTLEVIYELPYQAHATMEPMNCTADVRADRCEVWAPTQAPQEARTAAAIAGGLAPDAVTLHVTLMGGGFGRRLYTDYVTEAVQLSKAIGAPVQVVWSREDDLQHDYYRPAACHHISAGLDAAGKPVAWNHVIASRPVGADITSGAALRYAIPHRNMPIPITDSAIPAGAWRGVDYVHNVFVVESFLDEIAAAGGTDPYALRRTLLEHEPALLAVLDLAAERAGWGSPLPEGRARGIALCVFGRTSVAQVAEVSVSAEGAVRVHRVVCAVDCGLAVNPGIIEAQMESAIGYGLTAALKGEITIAGGRVEQSNFDTYPLLRMNEMPAIEVAILPGNATPSGIGEPGVPPIAAAVANAVFAATGKRIRRLPIRPEDVM